MKNAFDTTGPSLFTSTAKDRRNFQRQNATYTQNFPPFSLTGSSKHPKPQMMKPGKKPAQQ